VRANLRPRASGPPAALQAGCVSIDPLRREVTVDGRAVSLSAREFSLLTAFADHPGQVLSRQELLSMAWNINFDTETNLVDVYVGYLRRKLGEPAIETVRGAGYRLQTEGHAALPNGSARHKQT
jgi:DNA-binding response OmpR family regulator